MSNEITQLPTKAHSMNGRGREGLDLGQIFEAGFRTREASEADSWHNEHANPLGWHWHASAVAGCPREQVLKRAGLAKDGITLDSALTFELGHYWHSLMEKFAPAYAAEEDRFKVVLLEQGGYHKDIPLAARCDLLFSWQDELILADLKTEKPFAKARRQQEADLKGYPYPYKWEHMIQLHATAMVLESLNPEMEILEGRLLYLDKSSFQVDQVPCPITPAGRSSVAALVAGLEQAWARYELDGTLPEKLSASGDVWKCAARSDTNPKGKWCAARSYCQAPERTS